MGHHTTSCRFTAGPYSVQDHSPAGEETHDRFLARNEWPLTRICSSNCRMLHFIMYSKRVTFWIDPVR